MMTATKQLKSPLRIGLVLMIAALGILLVNCEAHHPITAQYVAQGRLAHSVTVFPISHPDIPADKAQEQAERIAERLRYLHPDMTVMVADMAMGEPVEDVLMYAKHHVMTGHFVHGHVWGGTPKRPYDQIEFSERITRNGREVWSLSAQFDEGGSDSEWETAMDKALDAIIDRLPGENM